VEASFYQILFFLIIAIVLVVLLTAHWKVHPFFALMAASFVVGCGSLFSPLDVINFMKDGFGGILKSLGFIIVVGTTLGILLEYTGSTSVMARSILKIVGKKNSALAMSLTGFVVGLPIFCDSGFIVLNGLSLSLARQTGVRTVVMGISLATGLYSVHCLIPPHPGAAAAAGIIGTDYGKLILLGIIVAIPAMFISYRWTAYAGNKIEFAPSNEHQAVAEGPSPSIVSSFLPVIVPIALIALKSFLITGIAGSGENAVLSTLGDPIIALTMGVLLALLNFRYIPKNKLSPLMQEAAEKAGSILVIIGAGGAFGAVLAATQLGKHFSETLPLGTLGILFPFLLTFILKTAQGSSTVAIITAAAIVQPLLPALGLDTNTGRLLAVLSMGGGSMMISHANDAYFWVISRFGEIEMKAMLRVYSAATILMGLTTLLMVYLLSLIL
jgi:gluconate:H+ symporter, GntP family